MAELQRVNDAEPTGPSDGERRWLRPAVWLLTIFIVVVLLALPILRAISVDRRQDNASAARDARAYVATQFAEAVLEHRSTRLAEAWARNGLHADIDAVVAELQLRDSAELEGAAASTYRASCPGAEAVGAANDCFMAQLTQPGGTVVATLRFTVSIVDGRATVVMVLPGTRD
jgi:hypothetical protein